MFLSRWRLLLALGFFFYAIYLTTQLGFAHSWYVFLGAIMLFVMHFLFGTVWAGINQLEKGDYQTAKIILGQVKRPDWLLKRPRGYYYFGWGIINMREEDYAEAEANFKESLNIGLRTTSEAALVNMNLAHINYKSQNYEACKTYLQAAKEQATDDENILKRMEELEIALSNMN